MSNKPTGVFVRLPLSDEQISAADAIAKEIAENNTENEWRFARHHFASCDNLVRALGTPVTGGDIPVIGTIHIGENGKPFFTSPELHSVGGDVVRQSDAQAQIAALEAEVVRLREALDRLRLIPFPMMDLPAAIMHGIAHKALKDGAA